MKLPGSAKDPLWYKDAIIYELHVKTFFDGNNDGIGDLPGLIQKLDYLQNLGVTCLWLLPFYPSPLRDDGYDIADYLDVHPNYGSLEDFRSFLKAAHEREMQVMIELVINHTSDQHPWFQAARQAPPGSREREFYVWSDTDKKYADARIIFTDTEKSNWTWDPVAKAYYWHRFFSHQPDLNFDNPEVIEAILKIMSFWLEMGVDGLRLDAIPYLVERDGTNCENLPETHALVKRIRHALDERFANRMILAEANQWPTDVRAYFGDGDECHMAFHFPVMPRLFMALRLEDRHPVTDIIAQTPDIPANCQWGLFLRNHDELTLEMVTHEERDYMYLAYSADPQMRINIGIRRRLAPLMDNNRRRMELLNSLLFSFPGTPILYYGDEIGMGDNIYLGDRNSVRTPMQWTGDRNAGFSRATPARLVSPIVMDPVYGYESINVEAQQEDPSSLLNWMRNMIALRKLFQVFGRGTIEFFDNANRKILAYVRRNGDDRILCVANLSRFAQPTELDLSAYAGLTPVEMLGYVEFPKVGRAPYTLTLGPYGFLWFELQGELEAATPESGGQRETPAMVLDAGDPLSSLFRNRAKSILEERVLPNFLAQRRWAVDKSRNIRVVRVKDWGKIAETSAAVAIVEAEFDEGGSETYLLPLGFAQGERAAQIQGAHPAAVLDAATAGAQPGIVFDATWGEEAGRRLLAGMRDGAEFALLAGRLHSKAGKALAEYEGALEDLVPRHNPVEQSDTPILFGNRFGLKVYRPLEPGLNPDCEMVRFLTEEAGFGGVQPFAGVIEYERSGMRPADVAMLYGLVENQGDGWHWTLEELRRHYEGGAARENPAAAAMLGSLFELANDDLPAGLVEQVGLYYDSAVSLGRRTAELHQALASRGSSLAFVPEPFTQVDRRRLADDFRDRATTAFDLLKAGLAQLPDDLLEPASLVLSLRRRVLARIGELGSLEFECVKTRVHGDFHLGRVLRAANEYLVVGFEGKPGRPLEERRAKQCPLVDVAGMLRSFSYAAHSALLSYAARRPGEADRLEPSARSWERVVSAAFLRSYRGTADGARFLPADHETFQRLLEVFLLDQAMQELCDELSNRPAWVRIPLWGILALGLGGPALP